MLKKSNAKIYILLFLLFLFTFLWGLFSYLINWKPIVPFITNPVAIGFCISIILTTFIANMVYSLCLSKELYHCLEDMQLIHDGSYRPKIKSKSLLPLVNRINQAIQRIAQEQKEQLAAIRERTKQLDEKNAALNDAYMQMESSYGQLQAALEQLNETEQRYHSLVRNIPDIVLTLDSSGNITYANRACREVLKFRRHDIVGKAFDYVIHPPSASLYDFNALKQNIDKNGEQRIDIFLRRKDESFIQTEIKFTPVLESPNNDSIQAIIRDVTEQKRMESILVETNRRLEILNGFRHKLTAITELNEIYKICANTVTEKLNFHGCIFAVKERNDRFYRIKEHSGVYFKSAGNLERFSYIHRNAVLFADKEMDGVVLNNNSFGQCLMKNLNVPRKTENDEEFYIQELCSGGRIAGLILVVSKTRFLPEELEMLRSIGHTASAAVDNALHLIETKQNYVQTIDALIAAIEAKDQYTRGHSQRVSGLAVKIGRKMGMTKEQVEELRIAGILHDIGKIGISDSILQKKGPLTREEYEEIKKHPAISNKILYPIGLSDRILKAIAFHHERFDGKGYPFGLTNESLGIEPQIIAVADAFDAMTSSRPYRKPLPLNTAISELENNKGTQFHPDIVELMIQIQNENTLWEGSC